MSGDAFRPFRERVAEDEAQVIAFQLGGELHACDIHLVEEVHAAIAREVDARSGIAAPAAAAEDLAVAAEEGA
ncbi:MAG TPA: hypothetical protein VJT67_14980 [Longimicrobiaceae bacterium]|nr:hypothetical protein [Longimicrobiaceae bacterium]